MISVELPQSQKHSQKTESAGGCVDCRAFTCLTDTKVVTRERRVGRKQKTSGYFPDTKCSRVCFVFFPALSSQPVVECSNFSNSLRYDSWNGWRSLLLANNSSSCSQAVSLYEKIWENDAVCVYRDSVWRKNPIKMMKKPHLPTSHRWAGLLTIQWSERRRSAGRGK